MSAGRLTGAFNKFRFDWKKKVFASERLSRGAKQMAVFLCENYVNKHNGCCWPTNETLAKNMCLSKRSVQRHLKELIDGGWLRLAKIKNARRAFQISIPGDGNGDIEHAILSPSGMPKLSSVHDTAVAPYKNQGYNQEQKQLASTTFPTVSVGSDEENILKHWNSWIGEHTEYNASRLFELLRRNSGYILPARFPKVDEAPLYRNFFQAVIASDGAILPGKGK